jgi:hypothetical protein
LDENDLPLGFCAEFGEVKVRKECRIGYSGVAANYSSDFVALQVIVQLTAVDEADVHSAIHGVDLEQAVVLKIRSVLKLLLQFFVTAKGDFAAEGGVIRQIGHI